MPSDTEFMLGSYASAIYSDADGMGSARKLNVERTIEGLKSAHVNTYAYLLAPSPTESVHGSDSQWRDLPQFARAASEAGINIYIYLVPPTGALEAQYPPFGWDYLSWADQIGALASRYRSIRGVMIDDFGGNVSARSGRSFHFTPAYVWTMRSKARSHAPWIRIHPVMYYHDVIGARAVLSDYREVVDGIVFPYAGADDGVPNQPGNTIDPTLALAQGRRVSSVAKCPTTAGCFSVNFPSRREGDNFRDVSFARARLTPVANARRSVRFQTNHDQPPGSVASYVEAVIDGRSAGYTLVDGDDWSDHTIDLTAATRGKNSVAVEFRVVRRGGTAQPAESVLLADVTWVGFGEPTAISANTMIRSDGLTVTPARSIDLIYMTYTAPLGVERGAGASPEYVSSVLTAVDDLRRQRQIDGSLAYLLNVTGGSETAGNPQNLEIVRRVYRRWSK